MFLPQNYGQTRELKIEIIETNRFWICYVEAWRFTNKNRKSATVRPSGPLRVNNGDAMMPALIAGVGLGTLPEFILRDALDAGRLERLLVDWSLPSGAVYWVTPPGRLRPKRVEVLADLLIERLGPQKMRDEGVSRGKAASQAKR